MTILLPRRSRGYQSDDARARYDDDLRAFCDAIQEIESSLDFKVSSRGWAYILEEHGVGKGDFDRVQNLINVCRKTGELPLDICAEDGAREFNNLEHVNSLSIEGEAESIVEMVRWLPSRYTPFSFWEAQDCFCQMLVEKIDLKSLFGRLCARYHLPIANARGWADINSRADMMRRFAKWEAKGKQCVLLYCGDFDPVGLAISDFLRSNMAELTGAVGWSPDHLVIDRFGLNADFIEQQGLTWIEGLETGSGKDLSDPRHPDHGKPHVQAYLREYGARKVEANALVVRPDAGRDLCEQAILRYVAAGAPERYRESLDEPREKVAAEVLRLLHEEFGG